MISNTAEFIAGLTAYVNTLIPCYYESASLTGGYPYAVVNGLLVSSLNSGDLVPFYIDVYADETQQNATVALEEACDLLRNNLNNRTIYSTGVFYATIGFDTQGTTGESEFDLTHRKLSLTARIFYTGGSN